MRVLDTTPLPDDPLEIAEAALRFRASREAHSASHAIGGSDEGAVLRAAKHHQRRIAFHIAAGMLADLRSGGLLQQQVESYARAHLRTKRQAA